MPTHKVVYMKNKIKIAAFSNTSSEIIVKKWDFKKVFLPSDKVKDSEIVIKELEDTDYFICLGQKPAIKNKICLELVAKNNADEIKTNFEVEKLIEEFKKNDIQIIKSTNPGKSYCNQVYWNSLNYIKDNSLNCKILFVHVPHIHVICGDDESVFTLDGEQLEGEIPQSKEKLVEAWIEIHKEDLQANWKLLDEGEQFFKIDPLR